MKLPRDFKFLINELEKLPGLGPKSAMRLAIHLMQSKDSNAIALSSALSQAKKNTKYCKQCGALTDDEICEICSDSERDMAKICVVENIVDLLAIERAGFYSGLYHVLGGVISPFEGVDESEINLESLFPRLKVVTEIIFALPSSIEADATFLIMKDRIEEIRSGLKLSKVAIGLPVGSNIDYADSLTLIRSFENRFGA
jgi:recombination protein RecR